MLTPQREASWFLISDKGRTCPGVGLEGWLRWLAHPLVILYARSMHNTVFASCSSEVAVGFLDFLNLIVGNLPQQHMQAVIFSPL